LGEALGTGSGANRAVKQRRANAVEKARSNALTLHQTHGTGIAVGKDGLRGTLRDGSQATGDVIQGDIPTHTFELTCTFGAHSFKRVQHALGVVAALGIT
jgi:hypothetical protein